VLSVSRASPSTSPSTTSSANFIGIRNNPSLGSDSAALGRLPFVSSSQVPDQAGGLEIAQPALQGPPPPPIAGDPAVAQDVIEVLTRRGAGCVMLAIRLHSSAPAQRDACRVGLLTEVGVLCAVTYVALAEAGGPIAVDASAVCALAATQQGAVREGWMLRIRAQSSRLRPLLDGCILEPSRAGLLTGRAPCPRATVIPATLR
jgi:hypothetical protein